MNAPQVFNCFIKFESLQDLVSVCVIPDAGSCFATEWAGPQFSSTSSG